MRQFARNDGYPHDDPMPSDLEVPSAVATPVTVVLATRDRPLMLAESLKSLCSVLRPIDRLIVVDSASKDASVGQLAEESGAVLVRCEEPGLSRARNAGWRAATTEIVAFTDDDCSPAPGWTEAVAAAFARGPLPDFVTGQVVSDGANAGRAQLELSVITGLEDEDFGSAGEGSTMGHGANMAWRRSTLEKMGGFDESLGAGSPLRAGEDEDAFWRVLRAGGRGRFDPESVVVHRQWRDRRGQLKACYGYGIGSGALAVKRRRSRQEQAEGLRRGACGMRSGLVVRVGAELLWHHFVEVVRRALTRHEIGVVAELVTLAGALRGMVHAAGIPLVDGHFAGSS